MYMPLRVVHGTIGYDRNLYYNRWAVLTHRPVSYSKNIWAYILLCLILSHFLHHATEYVDLLEIDTHATLLQKLSVIIILRS